MTEQYLHMVPLAEGKMKAQISPYEEYDGSLNPVGGNEIVTIPIQHDVLDQPHIRRVFEALMLLDNATWDSAISNVLQAMFELGYAEGKKRR